MERKKHRDIDKKKNQPLDIKVLASVFTSILAALLNLIAGFLSIKSSQIPSEYITISLIAIGLIVTIVAAVIFRRWWNRRTQLLIRTLRNKESETVQSH